MAAQKRALGLGSFKAKALKVDTMAQGVESEKEQIIPLLEGDVLPEVGSIEDEEITQAAEEGNGELFFELPEDEGKEGKDLEEVEIDAIYKAAENAIGEYEDAVAGGESKKKLKTRVTQAATLINATINECNRLMHERGSGSSKTFHILLDSLYQREVLGKNFEAILSLVLQTSGKENGLLRFLGEYLAGIKEIHGEESWWKVLNARNRILNAIAKFTVDQEAEHLANALFSIDLANVKDVDLLQHIWKLTSSTLQLTLFNEDDVALQTVSDFSLALFASLGEAEAYMEIDLKISKANWISLRAEASMSLGNLAEAQRFIIDLKNCLDGFAKSATDCKERDVDEMDEEAEASIGEIKAKYYMLLGSLYEMKGNDRQVEQAYQAAFNVFKALNQKFDRPIPDYIYDLVQSS